LFEGQPVRRFVSIARLACRKLAILDTAACLSDLRTPPGNRLEQLRGDRHGQHSIRINDQFRISFVWTEAGAEESKSLTPTHPLLVPPGEVLLEEFLKPMGVSQ